MKKIILSIVSVFAILFCSVMNVSASQNITHYESYNEYDTFTVTKPASSFTITLPAYEDIDANASYTGSFTLSDGTTGEITFSQYNGQTHLSDGYIVECHVHYQTNFACAYYADDFNSGECMLSIYGINPQVTFTSSSTLVDVYNPSRDMFFSCADGTEAELIRGGTTQVRTQYMDVYNYGFDLTFLAHVRSSTTSDGLTTSAPSTHTITISIPSYSFDVTYWEIIQTSQLTNFWTYFKAYVTQSFDGYFMNLYTYVRDITSQLSYSSSDFWTNMQSKVGNYIFGLFNMFYDEDGKFWINFDTKLTDILDGYWGENSPSSEEVQSGIADYTKTEVELVGSSVDNMQNFDFDVYTFENMDSNFVPAVIFITNIMTIMYDGATGFNTVFVITCVMLFACVLVGFRRLWK